MFSCVYLGCDVYVQTEVRSNDQVNDNCDKTSRNIKYVSLILNSFIELTFYLYKGLNLNWF